MIKNLKNHLKTTTLPLHEWLEDSDLFSHIKNSQLSKLQYTNLLIKLYQFIKVLEPQIKKYEVDFTKEGLVDIDIRLNKQKWLEEDLDFFNIPLSNDDSLKFYTLNSFSSIVGALYVLEGSTMGGMQIVKIAKKSIEEDISLQYYKSYQDKTMPMWLTYANWLDNTLINEYEATLGATEVFIALKKHFDS